MAAARASGDPRDRLALELLATHPARQLRADRYVPLPPQLVTLLAEWTATNLEHIRIHCHLVADHRPLDHRKSQRVADDERADAEHVVRRSLEADFHLGGGDRHALAGPDEDRHALPAPVVGGGADRDEGLRGRFRVDPLDLVIALVLTAHRVLGDQRPQRGYHP
jgi:hypothetical protein